MDWFLYDNGLRHERVKENLKNLAPFDFPKPTVEDISLIVKSSSP